jgi:hypothetical protein
MIQAADKRDRGATAIICYAKNVIIEHARKLGAIIRFIQKRLLYLLFFLLPVRFGILHPTSKGGWDVVGKKHPQQCGIVVD